MTETTEKILSALATAASDGVVELPLTGAIYPPSSVRATATAFSAHCRIEALSLEVGSTLRLTALSALPLERRKVIGEALNHLLIQAVRDALP